MIQTKIFIKSLLSSSGKNAISILPLRCMGSSSSEKVQKTALYDFHLKNKGKVVDFGGYLLPVQYADLSITASHLHTRGNASVFDVSHMLQTEIQGKDCIKFMETLCTADIEGLKDGSGSLTVFTNEKGGILDDLIVTRVQKDHLYVVSNAARKAHDINLMNSGLEKFKKINPKADVQLRFFDTSERSLLALQGPKAAAALQDLIKDLKLENLYFMQSVKCNVAGIDSRVTRCGYTGEDGFEISISADKGPFLAEALLKASAVKLAGLGARDSLRLEAGLCLYGNDIDETTSPIEAGLTWLVAKRRRETVDFPGANIILNQIKNGVDRKRVGILSQKGPPARSHTDIYARIEAGDDFIKIGSTTSGSPSPSLSGCNVAMGYIDQKYNKIGTPVWLRVRDKNYPAQISKMPFVKSNYYSPPKK